MPTTSGLTSERRASDLLADHADFDTWSGKLDESIHLPNSWRLSLLDFIANELPKWRDDPRRPTETAEPLLTSQLCAHMNSASRMSPGWDFLQFRIEEPDEINRGRKVDLIPASVGASIWIDGREYTRYASLMPIECKRLPTPDGPTRDEREYLYSSYSSTGGVQRFKEGHHGAAHSIAAMIAYIQSHDVEFWTREIRAWLCGLVATQTDWVQEEALRMARRDFEQRTSVLKSMHLRSNFLPPIHLHHLWVEMNDKAIPQQ